MSFDVVVLGLFIYLFWSLLGISAFCLVWFSVGYAHENA